MIDERLTNHDTSDYLKQKREAEEMKKRQVEEIKHIKD